MSLHSKHRHVKMHNNKTTHIEPYAIINRGTQPNSGLSHHTRYQYRRSALKMESRVEVIYPAHALHRRVVAQRRARKYGNGAMSALRLTSDEGIP